MKISVKKMCFTQQTKRFFLISVYICFFAIWLFYFKSMPILFDSWIGYMDYKEEGDNIVGLFKIVFWTGGEWRNARYVPNLISGILIRYEWMMDFVNALMLATIPLLIEKIIRIKHNIYAPIMMNTMLFGVSSGIVRSVYGYASVLYLFPLYFLLLYLCVLSEYFEDKKLNKLQYTFFFGLSYLNACFLEHISFAYTGLLLILLIYRKYKIKKWDIPLAVCCFISGIETCRLFLYILCTGTRSVTPGGDGLLSGIMENTRILYIETWCCNPIIFAVCLIVLGLNMQVCLKKCKKKKGICGLYWLFTCIWLIYAIVIYWKDSINLAEDITKETVVWGISVKWMPILLTVLILFHVGMVIITLMSNQYIGFVGMVGIMSLIPMILTSNLGYRISSFYVFSVCIICTGLFSMYQREKTSKKWMLQTALLIVAVLSIYRILSLSVRIGITQKAREYCVNQTIQKQQSGEWKADDILEIPKFKAGDVHVAGMPEVREYYREAFCYYYGLDENTIIKSIE